MKIQKSKYSSMGGCTIVKDRAGCSILDFLMAGSWVTGGIKMTPTQCLTQTQDTEADREMLQKAILLT